MIALTEPLPTLPRRAASPLLPSPSPTAAVAILARVHAILEVVRQPDTGDCTCETCQAVYAAPFCCEECGYRGRPMTHGCDCHRNLSESLSLKRITLKMYGPGAKPWPAEWKTTHTDTVREAAQLRRLGHAIRSIDVCAGQGRGMPPGTRLFAFDDCCHGIPKCPVCGDVADEANIAYRILRELNAVLASAGETAARVGPFSVNTINEDGHRWREVRSAPCSVDGQRVELVLGEDMMHAPDSYWLEVNAIDKGHEADRSLGVYLSAADIDWTIDTLVALRERARAEGILK